MSSHCRHSFAQTPAPNGAAPRLRPLAWLPIVAIAVASSGCFEDTVLPPIQPNPGGIPAISETRTGECEVDPTGAGAFDGSTPGYIVAEAHHNFIHVEHRDATRRCQSDISFTLRTEGTTLILTERDASPIQRCICVKDTATNILNLTPGTTYTVIVRSEDGTEYGRVTVTLPGAPNGNPNAQCRAAYDCQALNLAHPACVGGWACESHQCTWICDGALLCERNDDCPESFQCARPRCGGGTVSTDPANGNFTPRCGNEPGRCRPATNLCATDADCGRLPIPMAGTDRGDGEAMPYMYCQGGYSCQAGACVFQCEPTTCERDAQCPAGYHCETFPMGMPCRVHEDGTVECPPTVGQCMPNDPTPPTYCYSDSECPRGRVCRWLDPGTGGGADDLPMPTPMREPMPPPPPPGICVEPPHPGECNSDRDCAPDHFCAPTPCAPPPVDENGNPLIPDYHCPNFCVPRNPDTTCYSNADCAAGEWCEFIPVECPPDMACPAVMRGVCRPGVVSECSSDAECERGQMCIIACPAGPAPSDDPNTPRDPTMPPWPGECFGQCVPRDEPITCQRPADCVGRLPVMIDCVGHYTCEAGVCGFQCDTGDECMGAFRDPRSGSCLGPADGPMPDHCCEPLHCGGIAGLPCPAGMECVIRETYPDAMGICVRPPETVSCDPSFIRCRMMTPVCPTGQVPSVIPENGCWGPCVAADRCEPFSCAETRQCPQGLSCQSTCPPDAVCIWDNPMCLPEPPRAPSCNPAEAMCDAMPPRCPAGQVAEVRNGCWGACVPITACAPFACFRDRAGTYSCPDPFQCRDTCPPGAMCGPMDTHQCLAPLPQGRCRGNADCGADQYCYQGATTDQDYGICHPLGSCRMPADCEGQGLPHPMCVGNWTCQNNRCGWQCEGATP